MCKQWRAWQGADSIYSIRKGRDDWGHIEVLGISHGNDKASDKLRSRGTHWGSRVCGKAGKEKSAGKGSWVE